MLTKRKFILFETFSNQPLWELHEIAKKMKRKINALSKKCYFQKMLFENPVPLNMRLRMRPRSVTADKMPGIFAKRIWQPYYPSTCYTTLAPNDALQDPNFATSASPEIS